MPVRFTRVDEHVFRGGEPSPEEVAMLRDVWGVKKIISLDATIGYGLIPVCKELGLEQVLLPLGDGHSPNVSLLPAEVLQWENQGPVYVHCRHGKDRTGMACAMYRILVNGWTVQDALVEAYKFGMGRGLDHKTRDSYFQAVRNVVNEDSNHADTVVDQQRDTLETVQPAPASNDSSVPMEQQSFAPYSDVEVDHLNRPASLDMLERRRQRILKLAQKDEIVFRSATPGQILLPGMWSTSLPDARQMGSEQGKMYMASITPAARLVQYPQEPTPTLIQAAKLKDADVAVFHTSSAPDRYYLINPEILVDVRPFGASDVNHAVMVGEHDNYTGMQPFSFPGSGGFIGPAGGFAGMTQLPFESGF